ENSRGLILNRQYEYWPYIATGLVIIFLFWSRSIIHTLTVIRWPLEFGHNFFYIACTLLEAVAFTEVGNPLAWFSISAAYSVLIWLLFIWDLRMIRKRAGEDRGPAAKKLYAAVAKDQLANIRFLMPATLVFNLIAVVALDLRPEFFLQKGGHLIFVFFQLGAALGYLLYGIRLFNRLSPLLKDSVL
ncbi:MAG: hypothetical protein K8R69_02850, partial [Deltaproteobacteria bacterium]|nr:hypothetical protein [Deltaproteobacteria bacterium]